MYTACSVPYRTATFHACLLLPLDGRRWFGRDVVADAVDTSHLVDNLVAHASHEVVRQMSPVGSHGICRCNSTQSNRMLICTFITHNANRAYGRQKHRACLPYLVIKRHLNLAVMHVSRHTCCQHTTRFFTAKLNLIVAQATDKDVIGILKNANLLRRDVAKNAHGQTRTWERMSCYKVLRHSH